MKKKHLTIISFFFLFTCYSQDIKTEKLKKKKIELTSKINLLKDSLKAITNEIERIKSKEVLLKISDSALVAYVRKNAYIKKSPKLLAEIITQQKERKKAIVLDYSNGYIGACVEEICGYISEVWFGENQALNTFIYLKKEEAENLRNLKIEQEIKAEQKELAEQKKKYLKKYGKKVYTELKKGYIWIGMSKEMAIISRGYPKDNNRSVGSWGTHEQWVYDGAYLYFENGYLKSWQD
jgi:hypothetical protein